MVTGGSPFLHLSPGERSSAWQPGEGRSIVVQRNFNHIQHASYVVVYVLVRYAYDVEAAGIQDLCALLVGQDFRRLAVGHAVNFDDEFSIERYKIHNVSLDRMLAAKFPAGQPSSS